MRNYLNFNEYAPTSMTFGAKPDNLTQLAA